MSNHPIWPRSAFVDTGATIRFELYAFAEAPIPMDGASPASDAWSPFHTVPDCVDLGLYRRDTAPRLFDAILGGDGRRPMGANRLAQPDTARALFDRIQHCACVEVSLGDAPDLGYLQSAWAMGRWLVRRGAGAVYDDRARLWHFAGDLLAWPTPLPASFVREVSITFETDRAPGRGHMMHTRGLAKFGRPDLVLELVPGTGLPRRIDQSEAILTAMGTSLMEGAVHLPGSSVQLESETYVVAAYEPGVNAPDLTLENDGLLLVRR